MENNRIFGIYTAVLIGAVLSVITASVMAGVAVLPSFFVFVEHIAMSLLFRAAYKSLDGPYDILGLIRERRAAPAVEGATSSDMAGASS